MKSVTTKPIWDIAVRLFHWSLVLAVITSYITSEWEDSPIHIYSGYFIIGLLIFRILYGFFGSQHARFKDFVFGVETVKDYAQQMRQGKVKHYDGHNPLGGWMVVALLLMLSLTTLAGLMAYGAEGKGPLANVTSTSFISEAYAHGDESHDDDEEEESLWGEIHESLVNILILLVVLHILGVIVSSRIEKQNLVRAMITGYKSPPRDE
jgi:cytochrome b